MAFPMARRRIATLVAFACAGMASAGHAATITVNSNLDTTGNAAICTLRDAITAANTNAAVGGCAAGQAGPVVDIIAFNISGGTVITIDHATLGDLPYPSDPVYIDGYSQPGAQQNSQFFFQGSNAIPGVTLDGAGQAGYGLRFVTGSGGSTVRGLAIGGMSWGIDAGDAPLTISGNFIGVASDGVTALPNGSAGVLYGGGSNQSPGQIVVGGSSASDINVISGNPGDGLSPGGSAGVTWLVRNNYIGTARDGKTALPNGTGIGFNDTGLDLVVTGNVISGNSYEGVRVDGNHSVVVSGNSIGIGVNGAALGNQRDGVWVENSAAPGAVRISGNTIAYNGVTGNPGFDGVSVHTNQATQPTGVTITQNSIHSNFGLGINLMPVGENNYATVTPNDVGDADVGPNNVQNFPVLSSAGWSSSNSVMVVAGALNSTAAGTFNIEFFKNTSCDGSGNGEGETYLGTQQVTTDGAGNATFNVFLPSATGGGFVTATATNTTTGDTSEFSSCVTVGLVAATNNPPVAVNDSYTTPFNTALTVPAATGVLSNDSDPDAGDVITVSNWGMPTHGTLSSTTVAGNFVYTPVAGYSGADSFTYTVSDGQGGSATGTVNITVSAAGALPVLSIGNVTANEGNSGLTPFDFTVTLSAIPTAPVSVDWFTSSGSATPGPDYNGGTGTLTWAAGDTNLTRTVTVQVIGDIVAEPDETFSVLLNPIGLSGATIGSGTGLGTILDDDSVSNHAPVAVNDAYTVAQNAAITASVPGVLVNDSDPDAGDTITVVNWGAPAHGVLSATTATGAFTYTPAAGYSGPDSFTYTIDDGHGATATATVDITVTPAAVPTLSEWAMLMLAGLLGMVGMRRGVRHTVD